MQRFRLGLELLDESNAPAYQVHSLMSTQRQCKLEWDYKLYAIYLDMIYAILLLAAFSLLYCFFLPIALSGSTALLLGVAGTVLCFTMNALFAAIKQGVDVCKSVELSNNAALDCVENNPNNLDLTLSKSEWRYHQDIIKYKQACLIQSLLVDFLVPPVMFVALVFMPVSIGLVVVCAGLFLAVASYLYVDKTYKHDMTCLPKFSPDANIEGENVINPIIRQGFFGKGAHVLSKQRELELELGVMGCLRQAL